MPYTVKELVRLNQEIAGIRAGFLPPEGKNKARLEEIVKEANALEKNDPYAGAAALGLTVYADQPFKDANTRVGATAIYNNLSNVGCKVSHSVSEIKDWMTKHEIPNLQDPEKTQKEMATWLKN